MFVCVLDLIAVSLNMCRNRGGPESSPPTPGAIVVDEAIATDLQAREERRHAETRVHEPLVFKEA